MENCTSTTFEKVQYNIDRIVDISEQLLTLSLLHVNNAAYSVITLVIWSHYLRLFEKPT